MTASREAAADFTRAEHGRPALSPPVEREVQHFRDFQFAGYRRADGLFDIEGRMTDRKPYAFPNEWRGIVPVDDPLHDMRIRLTLDEHFLIHDVEVVTTASPYEICGAITPSFAALKGHHISKGWTRLLSEKFGGHHGCVHHVEMLRAMALYKRMEAEGAAEAAAALVPGISEGEGDSGEDLPHQSESGAEEGTVTPIDAAQRKRGEGPRPA